MGFTSGNGAISGVGNRAKKYAIVLFLSLVDFLFSKMGRKFYRGLRGWIGPEFARRVGEIAVSPFRRFAGPDVAMVCLITRIFSSGDFKQAFGGHVARGACPLHLVANRTNRSP